MADETTAAVENVSVTIDGMTLAVPKGTRLLDACAQAGVDVPHYCYHPGLSAPAQCRMCLVEVEKSPKLVPACVGTVADGIDRKSTRLNSSHGYISYAVFCLKKKKKKYK